MRLLLPLILASVLLAQPFREPFRPQFHFSPKVNWTNDPNGLVFFEGEYHLFYQYNPSGDIWGHMSWGHAVSTDLVRWKELPVAIPEADGVMIFTGSVVIDHANTSGFCKSNKGCMVAIYTGAHTGTKPELQEQSLAFSNDRGRTWTKYEKNPVLNLNLPAFRDPKVFWSEKGRRWTMAVALPDDHRVLFFGSPDLKQWERLGEFGPAGAISGQWECPELFELPVDEGRSGSKWILKVGLNPGSLQGGSGEQYFIGDFDGTTFTNENPTDVTLWTDYGKDCYCALTFNNLPATQPVTMLGWMNNWQYANKVPTAPWRGQMTMPRELSLRTTADGIRLVQRPLAALEKRAGKHLGERLSAAGGSFVSSVSMETGETGRAGWRIMSADGSYAEIGYDSVARELYVDRTRSAGAGFHNDFPARTSASYSPPGKTVSLDIFVDHNSIEVFTADGLVAITNLIFSPPADRVLFFSSPGGSAKPLREDHRALRSIW